MTRWVSTYDLPNQCLLVQTDRWLPTEQVYISIDNNGGKSEGPASYENPLPWIWWRHWLSMMACRRVRVFVIAPAWAQEWSDENRISWGNWTLGICWVQFIILYSPHWSQILLIRATLQLITHSLTWSSSSSQIQESLCATQAVKNTQLIVGALEANGLLELPWTIHSSQRCEAMLLHQEQRYHQLLDNLEYQVISQQFKIEKLGLLKTGMMFNLEC